MPTLKDFGSFQIVMYFHDHAPPHVHVVSADFEALVSLGDCAVFRGALPPRFRRAALDWIKQNRTPLLAKWEQLQ
jgi:hypothetical protein